jgi:hypothetical protein
MKWAACPCCAGLARQCRLRSAVVLPGSARGGRAAGEGVHYRNGRGNDLPQCLAVKPDRHIEAVLSMVAVAQAEAARPPKSPPARDR